MTRTRKRSTVNVGITSNADSASLTGAGSLQYRLAILVIVIVVMTLSACAVGTSSAALSTVSSAPTLPKPSTLPPALPPPLPPSSPLPPNHSPELLPDLSVRTVSDVYLDTVSVPGMRQLRFQTVTSNVGTGKFEINATRKTPADTFAVTQRIYHKDGTTTDIPVAAQLYFAGDEHNHWHVRDVDQFVVSSIRTNKPLRYAEKHGFCFDDNTDYRDWPGNPKHPASPAKAFYVSPQACALHQTDALTVQEGMSVGWGDTYPTKLINQYIDITGLPNGTYRLRQTTDWAHWFKESNEVNNTNTADIIITSTTATLKVVK